MAESFFPQFLVTLNSSDARAASVRAIRFLAKKGKRFLLLSFLSVLKSEEQNKKKTAVKN